MQLHSYFDIMETCYEDPEGKHEFSAEKVQTSSQAQNQSQHQQGSQPQNYKGQYPKQNNNHKSHQGIQFKMTYNQGYKPQYQGS